MRVTLLFGILLQCRLAFPENNKTTVMRNTKLTAYVGASTLLCLFICPIVLTKWVYLNSRVSMHSSHLTSMLKQFYRIRVVPLMLHPSGRDICCCCCVAPSVATSLGHKGPLHSFDHGSLYSAWHFTLNITPTCIAKRQAGYPLTPVLRYFE